MRCAHEQIKFYSQKYFNICIPRLLKDNFANIPTYFSAQRAKAEIEKSNRVFFLLNVKNPLRSCTTQRDDLVMKTHQAVYISNSLKGRVKIPYSNI